MEKRKRKDTKRAKKSEVKRDLGVDAKRNLKFLGIDNCISLYLSPQTQRYVGCQIGEHITAEEPWINVEKEKIEDSLFLHENSSEFLPLRDMIEDYPEATMLIGSYRTNQEHSEEFMICTTIEAKMKILELLANEKIAVIERVKRLIYCLPNKWNSLGSELEVNGNLNKNNRKLYEVIFDSKKPVFIGFEKVKFKYRFASVNSKFRTYDEILPDRRYYKQLVFRVRIDRASQISPGRHNIELQTILTFPSHKYTQTNEVFLVLKLTEPEYQKLSEGLNKVAKFMEDTLLVNFYINLYNNDYEFPNGYVQSYAKESKELMTFQDVINCKNLCFGSVSWNALISGLLAVSYVETPRRLIVNEKYLNTDKRANSRSLYDGYMVLLWCYTDNLSAKLYIHVNFEITSISFCPYDENILVGGGSGGQVVIWDLKNKLEEVEAKEYLTAIELNHRNIVYAHTTWVKWPPGVRHVFPTIISDLTLSHKSPVISIQWLPSYQYMTKMGQVEHIDNLPIQTVSTTYLQSSKSYQFFTCSTEDSCVFAWEIKQSDHMMKPERGGKKKQRRLSRMPESLSTGVSPLKKYNRNFQPFFKLKFDFPGERDKRIFITDFLLMNPKISYKALNPKTLNDFRERTFFKEITPNNPIAHSQKLVFSSVSGYLAECNWTANNFDQGQMINEQVCDMQVFLAIHDGPINSCRANSFYPKCILTVGGSVFGIWITSTIKKPLYWRKGSCRYISGIWSLQYPLLCMILREDNYIEYWDLVDGATKPLRKTKLKGSQVIDVLADASRTHTRKKKYVLTDIKGAIRLQDRAVFNELLNYEEMNIIAANTLNNMLMRKKNVDNLNERLKLKYNFSEMYILETPKCEVYKQPPLGPTKSELIEHRRQQNEAQPQVRATKWQRQEEVRMYETLLQQKRIDIAELKQNTIPLMEKLNERLEQQKKIDQKLALRHEIFDGHKKILLDTANIKRRKKITVWFPIEMEKIIKQGYLEDYKSIEKESLAAIARGGQRLTVTWGWGALLGKRKTEYVSVKKSSQLPVEIDSNTSENSFMRARQKIGFKNV